MQFIQIQDVTKAYANHLALDNVSIDVPRQSIFGLLGPNGAGKTSLIRILNQITAPDSGEIFFNGEKLAPKHVSNIGYLPEERGLYKKMKVGEQALYLAQLKGMPHKEAGIRLKDWFERFEISGWWNRKVEELSKGMQQKIQFIVTVIHEPELLIFDEPFSGFDPINVNILKDEILRLKKNGSTIIFSTHNMASVEELCDNIALINQGQKILEGKVQDIKRTYKNNEFEVQIKGLSHLSSDRLPKGFTLLHSKEIAEREVLAHIKGENESSSNVLIESLLPLGQLSVYREILPSMNDIFVQQIESQKNSNPS